MAGEAIEKVLKIGDEMSPAFKRIAEEAANLIRKDLELAAANKAVADSEREAAQRAKDEADALAEAAAATARQEAALAKLDPALREAVGQYKAAKTAALEQASALGVSVGELRALESATKKASAAQDEAGDATETAGDALGRNAKHANLASDASGKLGQSAAKMAGALSLVSPAAGDAGRNMADFADVAEVAAEAGAAVGLSSGVMVVALGAVATAVGVGYVAWQAYTEEEERAARIAADVQAAMNALEPILKSTRDATIDLKEKTGELSAEQAALARNATRAFDALQQATDPTRKKMAELREEQSSFYTQWVDTGEAVYATLGTAWEPLHLAFDGLTTSSAELQQEIDGLDGVLLAANADTRENVKVTAEVIKIDEENKKGKEAAAAATKAASIATDELAAKQDFLARMTAATNTRIAEGIKLLDGMFAPTLIAASDELDRFGKLLDGIVPPDTLSDTEALALAEADYALALSRGAMSATQQEEALLRLKAARDRVGDDDKFAPRAAAAAQMATGGPSAVMGAVSNAGPWGAIIAAIVELVGNFQDIGDTFNDFTIHFNESIGNLGNMLGDNLGRWLETGTKSAIQMVPDLINGIAANLDDIIAGIIESAISATGALIEALVVQIPVALVKLVASLFTVDFWRTIGEAFVDGFKDAVSGLFTGDGGMGRERGDSIVHGSHTRGHTGGSEAVRRSYDTGTTWVDRTGIALLHRGEEVINSTGVGSERQETGRARARSATFTGSPGGMRGVVEFDIDYGNFSTAVANGRRLGHAL